MDSKYQYFDIMDSLAQTSVAEQDNQKQYSTSLRVSEIEKDDKILTTDFEEEIRIKRLSPFIDVEEVFSSSRILYNWERYDRVTAKIIELRDDHVEIECLIDEDKEIYQLKRIERRLLENVSLQEGNYLLFNYYKKGNEWRVEILDDQRLFLDKQFPKVDFDRFEKSSIFSND